MDWKRPPHRGPGPASNQDSQGIFNRFKERFDSSSFSRGPLRLMVLTPIMIFTGIDAYHTVEPFTKGEFHFKLPIIQKSNYFEREAIEWDGTSGAAFNEDRKSIRVNTAARRRSVDPLQFPERVGNNVNTAMSHLDGMIDSVVRNHASNRGYSGVCSQ